MVSELKLGKKYTFFSELSDQGKSLCKPIYPAWEGEYGRRICPISDSGLPDSVLRISDLLFGLGNRSEGVSVNVVFSDCEFGNEKS